MPGPLVNSVSTIFGKLIESFDIFFEKAVEQY